MGNSDQWNFKKKKKKTHTSTFRFFSKFSPSDSSLSHTTQPPHQMSLELFFEFLEREDFRAVPAKRKRLPPIIEECDSESENEVIVVVSFFLFFFFHPLISSSSPFSFRIKNSPLPMMMTKMMRKKKRKKTFSQ